ncbi:MAG: DNA-deoxyinosine glycosylase [Candidatus Pacearchaeota archaeon]
MIENDYSPPNLIADENTEILILGTFTGEKSKEKRQYYKSSKFFWNIIGEAKGDKELFKKDYISRIKFILNNRIGIWDVFESCERKDKYGNTTSKDRDIKNGKPNDFSNIKKNSKIKLIIFNGAYAYWYGLNYGIIDLNDNRIKYVVLPSTSGSQSFKLRQKLWLDILTKK